MSGPQRALQIAVGADLGRDLPQSGSNTAAAIVQATVRQPLYDGYATDRQRGSHQHECKPANGLFDMLEFNPFTLVRNGQRGTLDA